MFEKLKKIFNAGRHAEKEMDTVRNKSSVSGNEQQPKLKKKEKDSANNLTKTGIRKLDPNASLYDLFQTEDREETDRKPEKPRKGNLDGKTKKNKHGIPILDHQNDYTTFFLEEMPERSPEETSSITAKNRKHQDDTEIDFADMINTSFKGKTTEDLLAEKTGTPYRKNKISLKQKLKLYPSPQVRLDLHGYTASAAERKADTFLRNARAHGTRTLLIIVGKGLHSEDGRAILRDVAEELLIRLTQEKIVLAYEWDNRKKSKSGAVIVYLNF